jgi:hypothetical protein
MLAKGAARLAAEGGMLDVLALAVLGAGTTHSIALAPVAPVALLAIHRAGMRVADVVLLKLAARAAAARRRGGWGRTGTHFGTDTAGLAALAPGAPCGVDAVNSAALGIASALLDHSRALLAAV